MQNQWILNNEKVAALKLNKTNCKERKYRLSVHKKLLYWLKDNKERIFANKKNTKHCHVDDHIVDIF